MLYEIVTDQRTAGGRTGPVVTLRHNAGLCSAEVWVGHGFNCLEWKVSSNGVSRDVLYRAAEWEDNPVPTRSGTPILFPFPNRIRGGRFQFDGVDYTLACNDSTKQNAIHGWAPRHAWRVVDQGTDHLGAFVTGQFRPSLDAREVRALWPADYQLNITYRLGLTSLRVEAEVTNPGPGRLPFGLGFHPYFRFPLAGPDGDIGRYRLRMPARAIWPLEESLPGTAKAPVPPELEWSRWRMVADAALDTLYTDLDSTEDAANDLFLRASLRHADHPGALHLWASREFREMVLFTPAHRKALCVEPYTCPTDAVHLQAQGVDAGWQTLAPGGVWRAAYEVHWDEKATGQMSA